MAVVIPYGDAEAHGSICDSLSFRRSRGGVILQKKPRVKQPNSQAQQDQKQWFKDVWDEWGQLAPGQLKWLKDKATEEQTFPANYYFDKFKDAHGPNGVPQNLFKHITDMSLPVILGVANFTMNFVPELAIIDPPSGVGGGTLWDDQNVFSPVGVFDPYDVLGINIIRHLDPAFTIPDDHEILIDYKLWDDSEEQETLYLPAIPMVKDQVYTYWFDTSMSMYNDKACTDLVKANFWPHPWPPEE